MSTPLDYERRPTNRRTSVVVWAGCVLIFGAIGLALFCDITTRDTGATVPTTVETVLRMGPLWFIYPYHSLIPGAKGDRGLFIFCMEVFGLYPIYAVLFGFSAYCGKAQRLLLILAIVHVVLGIIGTGLFIAASVAFDHR